MQAPMGPEPFEIAVPDAELDDLRSRLAHTRWADDLGNADWRYGVERGWLEDMVRYWGDQYDWRATERKINQLGNFKVTIDGVPLHFALARARILCRCSCSMAGRGRSWTSMRWS